MKRPELITILAIAMTVLVGGWVLLRPNQSARGPIQVAAPIPKDSPNAVSAHEPVIEPTIQKPPAPIDDPVANVAAHQPAPASAPTQDNSHVEPNAVYEASAKLSAGALPEDLIGFLKRGIIPDSENILKGSEASRHQEKDAVGQSLEETMRTFIAAQPESRGVNYMVSCGISLCELQMEQMTAESGGSALSLIEFRIMAQPWFSSTLVRPGAGGYGSKDKHFYLIRYWKRQ